MNQPNVNHYHTKDIQDGNFWTHLQLSEFRLIGATRNTIPDAIKIIHSDPNATIHPLENVTFGERFYSEGEIKVFHYDLFGHLFKEDPNESINFGMIILELWPIPRIQFICYLPNHHDWAHHYLNYFANLLSPGDTDSDKVSTNRLQVNHNESSTLKQLSEPTYVFYQDGDHWKIRYENEEGHFRDLKGFRLIHAMLRNPLKEFTSIEIYQAVNRVSGENVINHRYDPDFSNPESGYQIRNSMDGNEEVIDIPTIKDVTKRIMELKDEIEQIESLGGDASGKKEEVTLIENYLMKALGKRGISRSFSTDNEKARKNVQQLIRISLNRIQSPLPLCFDHLKKNIHTGVMCYYSVNNNWLVEKNYK